MGAVAVLGALFAFGVSSSASATSYDYSFSNVDGAVNGTVTGTIVLPNGDGTFTATSVSIDSYPSALGLGPTPISSYIQELENTFTVSGGNITSGEFEGNLDGETALFISSDFLTGGSGLDLEGCGCLASEGVRDSTDLTLSFAPVATPIPATWTMLIAGFVGLGFFAYGGSKKSTGALASA
jgi:hypothetical protein